MDKVLTVKLASGEDLDITLLDTFEIDGTNKQYIAYTLHEYDGDNIKVYIAILKETDEGFNIEDIENEEELETAKTVYNNLLLGKEE